MFHVLQALRFGFAVMIFLHHVELFEAGGSCGVSFFLVLSGFVMSRGYAEKVAQPGFSWRHYMGRRILRLWPLHLVCLLVAVAVRVFLYGEEVGGWWWLPNLCLLQSWLPYPHIYFSGNAVSWCLSDLLFFYALFPWLSPLLYGRAQRNGASVSRSFVLSAGWGRAVVVVFLVAYAGVMWLLPERYGNSLLYVFPLMRLPDFILGMWCYRWYDRHVREGRVDSVCGRWRWTAFRGLALMSMAAACWLYYHVPLNASFAFIFWLPAAFVVVSFAEESFQSADRHVNSCYRWWTELGNISFAFYMIHQPCIRGCEACARIWSLPETLWLRLPLYFAVSLGAAFLLHYGIERPLARLWLQKRT